MINKQLYENCAAFYMQKHAIPTTISQILDLANGVIACEQIVIRVQCWIIVKSAREFDVSLHELG